MCCNDDRSNALLAGLPPSVIKSLSDPECNSTSGLQSGKESPSHTHPLWSHPLDTYWKMLHPLTVHVSCMSLYTDYSTNSFLVGQWLEHGASNAKVTGSIPGIAHTVLKYKCSIMQCKSLQIKASAKRINANVFSVNETSFVLSYKGFQNALKKPLPILFHSGGNSCCPSSTQTIHQNLQETTENPPVTHLLSVFPQCNA